MTSLGERAHEAGIAALNSTLLTGLRPAVRQLDLAVLTGIAAFLGEAGGAPSDVAPRHAWIPGHWRAALAAEGMPAPDGRVRRYRRAELITVRKTIDAARQALGYPPELTRYLLDSLRHLPELLNDQVSPQSLLFPNGDLDTAAAAYRDNSINRYLNAAAVEVTRGLMRDRVLELGAGTGSLTADLLPVMDGRAIDYVFTDLSAFFLESARERFGRHRFLRFEVVDFNQDLSDPFAPASFDLVIAVNAAHNALHTGDLLAQIRNVLAPDGSLVLIETCHEHHQSLVSMPFLLSGRKERRDHRAGTARTYLTHTEWLRALETAGLKPVVDLPHPDHPLSAFSQRLFVAHR
ncbi:class I SAM-dependent methyltransferase [Actinomadura fulvescens]|uniref:Methyltransferase type 12 domain-containing protein n=1 Tax=Actinomadura fulvescens TaxID=46160 RepID=A0ABN3QGL6_9ACTN